MGVVSASTPTNPIARLLLALPAAVSKEKDSAIQRELTEHGLWEHYRQFVAKQEVDLGKTNIRAASIFKKHLGVSDSFFLDGAEAQEREIKEIIAQHYQQVLKA